MGVTIQKKTIAGLDFELSEMPVFQASQAFHRFLAIAAPVLPSLTAGAAMLAKGKLEDADRAKLLAEIAPALLRGLPQVLTSTTPEKVEELAREMLALCFVKTKKAKVAVLDVLDELLRGKLPAYYQLLGWAAQVHFGGFLGARAQSADPAPEQAPESSSTSPTT